MSIKARTLWPTLINLETWVSRNCPNCRYIKHPTPNCEPVKYCDSSSKILIAHLQDTEIEESYVKLIFGLDKPTPANDTPQVPFMCQSRKDKRGRPPTEANAPLPPGRGQREMLCALMKDSLSALKNAREELVPMLTMKTYLPAIAHLDNAIAVVNAAMNSAISWLRD